MNLKSNSIYREGSIVRSLIDDDLYKPKMQQAMLHRCQFAYDCEYKFHCRTDEDLTPYIGEIKDQLKMLCDLQFTQSELQYLSKESWSSRDYIQYLKNFKLDYDTLYIIGGKVDGKNVLEITARGSAVDETLFEIHVLSIVSEVRNRAVYPDVTYEDIRKATFDKIKFLKSAQKEYDLEGLTFVEGGTRRRLSFEAQYTAIDLLNKELPDMFAGTSNIWMARELGLDLFGTQAHEWFQLFQQGPNKLEDSIPAALENWIQEYRCEYGIALTDIITMDAFISKFDKFYGKVYDGLRHDSGCPFEWGEKSIKMYENLGIDPRTKVLNFSDSLDFPLMVKLYRHFSKYIKVSFLLGGEISNSVPGVKRLNMVMKLLSVNGQPTAKISDSSGKTLCEDKMFLDYLGKVHGVKS